MFEANVIVPCITTIVGLIIGGGFTLYIERRKNNVLTKMKAKRVVYILLDVGREIVKLVEYEKSIEIYKELLKKYLDEDEFEDETIIELLEKMEHSKELFLTKEYKEEKKRMFEEGLVAISEYSPAIAIKVSEIRKALFVPDNFKDMFRKNVLDYLNDISGKDFNYMLLESSLESLTDIIKSISSEYGRKDLGEFEKMLKLKTDEQLRQDFNHFFEELGMKDSCISESQE